MSLNKSRGNMYSWTTHTWNPIRGKCPHDCVYCFMKDKDVGPLRLDEKALMGNLGHNRTIFVGSSTDMWATAVPNDWIFKVLEKCNSYHNTYIFQSKNPERFWRLGACAMVRKFPSHTILGTTLETNRNGKNVHVSQPWVRAAEMANQQLRMFRRMVSVEPVMAFDLPIFLHWLQQIGPEFVSIGADSKGHGLPEPTMGEVDMLVVELRKFTEVKLKKNLGRLLLREIKEA